MAIQIYWWVVPIVMGVAQQQAVPLFIWEQNPHPRPISTLLKKCLKLAQMTRSLQPLGMANQQYQQEATTYIYKPTDSAQPMPGNQ